MPPDIDITKELHKARRRSTMTPSEQVIADVASMGVHHAPVGKFHNVFESDPKCKSCEERGCTCNLSVDMTPDGERMARRKGRWGVCYQCREQGLETTCTLRNWEYGLHDDPEDDPESIEAAEHEEDEPQIETMGTGTQERLFSLSTPPLRIAPPPSPAAAPPTPTTSAVDFASTPSGPPPADEIHPLSSSQQDAAVAAHSSHDNHGGGDGSALSRRSTPSTRSRRRSSVALAQSPAASVSSKRSLASSSSASASASGSAKRLAAPSSSASSRHSGSSRRKSTPVVRVEKLTAAARDGYAIGLDLRDMTITRGQAATRTAASVASGNEPPEDTPELVHLNSPQAADEENLGTPSEPGAAVQGVVRLDTPPVPPAPLPEVPPLEFYAEYTITLWREENWELTGAEAATVLQHLDSILGRATQMQAWTLPSRPEYELKTTCRLLDEGRARTQIVVRYPLFKAHRDTQSLVNTMYEGLQGKIMTMLDELLDCPMSQKLLKKEPKTTT